MHSKQELEQTIALNAILTRRCIRREELQEALSAHGIIESNNPMPNYIKSLALNLERRFNKLNIRLFNVSAKIAAVYSVTDEAEMPPIVISQNENGEPKVVINTYHRLWISLNRRIIAGIIESLQEKMDTILTSYLEEQYLFEQEDLEMME